VATNRQKLSFRFQPRKFVEALTLFASAGVSDLTKLKAVKLVYFADRMHLLRFGRPIVGGTYYCLDKGPVPSEALDAINAAEAWAGNRDAPVRNELVSELDRKLVLQRTGLQIHRRIAAKAKPDRDVFSESELQVLSQVARELGRLSVGSLILMSHAHEAWRDADRRRPSGSREEMSYEMFFQDNPVDTTVLEAAEAEQEDRDFADALARAASRRSRGALR
jgi:uncharacterized phage-associated protein